MGEFRTRSELSDAVLVLVIGDLHVPYRSSGLSSKFSRLLVPVTGNACDRETYEYLRTVAPDVRAVRGDYDDNPNFPPSLVVQHGPVRIGLIHGHQAVPLGDAEALAGVARKMDVDVLVSGGTHRFDAYEWAGVFFVNPGSATGAMMASGAFSAANTGAEGKEPPSPTPSFVLLDVQGAVIVCYIYSLAGDDVKVRSWRLST